MSRAAAGVLALGAALLCSFALAAGTRRALPASAAARLRSSASPTAARSSPTRAPPTHRAARPARAPARAPRPTASRCAGRRSSRRTPPPLGPPRYDWSAVDALVEALRARGHRASADAARRARLGAGERLLRDLPAGPRAPCRLEGVRRAPSRPATRTPPRSRSGTSRTWRRTGRGTPDPAAYASLYGAALQSTADLLPRTPILVGGLALALAGRPAGGQRGDPATGSPASTRRRTAPASTSAIGRVALAVHPVPQASTSSPAPIRNGRFDATLAAVRGDRRRATGRSLSAAAVGDRDRASRPPPRAATAWLRPALQAKALLRTIERASPQPDVAATLIYTLVDRPPSTDEPSRGGLRARRPRPRLHAEARYCALAARAGNPHADGCTTG